MARLIDTSVFIEEERRRTPVPDLLDRLGGTEIALAAITASELLVGVHRAAPEARRIQRETYVEQVITNIPTIAFDVNIARVHARLAADMRSSGLPIGEHDLQIAATALALGYEVLTMNLRDFRRVPGLQVQSFTV
jgi:tRNA(fMet)-specific endonuclease VapC